MTISGNTAAYGGGLGAYQGNATLTNVIISGNTVDHYGGGMILSYSNPTLSIVTISGNTAYADNMPFGGGAGIQVKDGSNPIIINSILWNNSLDASNSLQEIAFSSAGEPGTVNVYYTDIRGGQDSIIGKTGALKK